MTDAASSDAGARRAAIAALYATVAEAAGEAVPVHLVREGEEAAALDRLGPGEARWARANGFSGGAKKQLVLPGVDGRIAGVLLGLGKGESLEPAGPSAMLVGQLAGQLPAGFYELRLDGADGELAAVAWGLGAYRFGGLKTGPRPTSRARLVLPDRVSLDEVVRIVEGVWLGRDLINWPAGDLGPAEIEAAVRAVGTRAGARVSSIVGDDLLAAGCRLIHAVGRASTRPPRLVDLTWGREGAPRLTLVGKGIAFDTGGLDIKPAAGMLLMKKDMGGAAAALAAADMIMAAGLDVRLRLLVPAAENAIAGNAMRPSDVVRSRAGLTVEIGNTDAEGRLVLADAISIADEEAPDALITLATLTGAARVALGPDLPAMFSTDDALAADLTRTGLAIGDPVWRMPFWPGYERGLDSEVADLGNVSDGPFAGAVTAALFLKRFVARSRRFVHFDIYGWRPQAKALGPKGGEPQVARLIHALARSGLLPGGAAS